MANGSPAAQTVAGHGTAAVDVQLVVERFEGPAVVDAAAAAVAAAIVVATVAAVVEFAVVGDAAAAVAAAVVGVIATAAAAPAVARPPASRAHYQESLE